STVAGLRHRALVRDELVQVAGRVAESESARRRADAAWALREAERARAIPESLARELAAARAAGFGAWRRAREADDFDLFAPALERLLSAHREEAAARAPDAPTYDAMLDDYEPGATEVELEPLFAGLSNALVPLVRAVAESPRAIDESAFAGPWSINGQWRLARRAAEAFGFNFERGRLDLAHHPFCVGLAPGDVRLTWRFDEGDLRTGLLTVLHETGHGLYEQGLPVDGPRRPADDAVSLGIHESQSRLWENHVGRSRGFWRWLAPFLEAIFPDRAPFDVERAWPALHVVRPSLIRVEADEVTYHLHVILRFELERALFAGRLTVAELPDAWRSESERLLGVASPTDRDGVLQDVHWSHGLFGYFPTYTLGSLAAAQLFAAAEEDLGDFDAAFERGELSPLLAWMRARVHSVGRRLGAAELLEEATGRPLVVEPMLEHLQTRVGAIYGVEALR
ncbi:MAG: carboxypeptidase M32, partial [Acidobacteriota bacterium]